MGLLKIKDKVKNTSVLLIISGMLLIQVINSFENLLLGISRLVFNLLPLNLLTIMSISLRGLFLITTVYILVRILTDGEQENKHKTIFISIKSFQAIGIISILIIGSSYILNLYFLEKPIEPSMVQDNNIIGLAYLNITYTGIAILTNIILCMIFFSIVLIKGTRTK